jgi:hypothetical protein
VDLTLRDGINLQQAIQIAKEIDQQSKQAGFNQTALDQMARQGYGNARFEVNSEEGLDLVEEYYTEENSEAEQLSTDSKGKVQPKLNQDDSFLREIQHGLQGSVRAVN